MIGGAILSDCRTYRYSLWRRWNDAGHMLVWLLLNPSTADENIEDPTLRRCIGYARSWGYMGVTILNLFALRSTDPRELYKAADPVGPANNAAIVELCAGREVICGWGIRGGYRQRDRAVLDALRRIGAMPKCLELTKDGYPKHPLYLRADLKPMEMGKVNSSLVAIRRSAGLHPEPPLRVGEDVAGADDPVGEWPAR